MIVSITDVEIGDVGRVVHTGSMEGIQLIV
jgi:hypothetical protein